ncbi:hypothetical protein B5M42_004780 [Paenibacillus athensensis]|uniref:Uncharacterized protein n=1 Tax=Paenibacillus athensensis TaxID=1967502 RepID=A0A4Y8PST0_9BACL|nr:hypothetical protein [Paenibacillus athensensis]MCD1258153.1 hypothetical protein [Paenibacillus athensensis]
MSVNVPGAAEASGQAGFQGVVQAERQGNFFREFAAADAENISVPSLCAPLNSSCSRKAQGLSKKSIAFLLNRCYFYFR